MNRRRFLTAGAATFALPLLGCDKRSRPGSAGVEPAGAALGRSAGRPSPTGKVTEVELHAAAVEKSARGRRFAVFGYNGQVPGPEIRVKERDTLRVRVHNHLPDGTTIHWHGVPVPNPMDGVPGVTQAPIPSGQSFTYEFMAWPAGTYVYHTHEGYQLDQGLYGPLIIEERHPPAVDRELVLVLEDWATVDGGGPAASRAGRVSGRGVMGFGMMRGGGMMHGGGMGWGHMRLGGTESGGDEPLLEPVHDAYAINGKLDPPGEVLQIRKGERARLRLINASSSTIYSLRVAGHELTVTHADGRPVKPVTVDAIRIGMGERYDARIEARNPGRWPILVWPDTAADGPLVLGSLLYEGIAQRGYSADSGFQGRGFGYGDLEALDEEGLPRVGGKFDRRIRLVLSGGMHSRHWTINGQIYPETGDLYIRHGERVRLEYYNHSPMPHPMHLHGHYFELDLPGRPRKDTVIVEPHMGFMAVEFVADNPGDWLHHCHNLYHLMAGMADVVRVPAGQ